MKPADIFEFMKKILSGCARTGCGQGADPDGAGIPAQRGGIDAENAGGDCCAYSRPADGGFEWDEVRECFQTGFTDFTTDREAIGFFIDPENRWSRLARDVFSAEMEDIYAGRLRQMRNATRGGKLSEKLGRLEQSEEVKPYWKQLELPFIDSAVQEATQNGEKAGEEEDTAESGAGRPPFPFRLAFGILIVQELLGLSDRGTCRIVSESPYIQYFLGYGSFSTGNTVDPSNLVHFRGRLDLTTMQELNDILIRNRRHAGELKESLGIPAPAGDGVAEAGKDTGEEPAEAADGAGEEPAAGDADGGDNSGTLILDATCGPVNIRYPQDFSILNEARLCLEKIIERICREHSFKKPRTYVLKIQSEFLSLAKSKARKKEDIRHVVRIELNAVARSLGYINRLLGKGGVSLTDGEIERIQVIRAVHAQQKYMFSENVHRVQNRIVSISMPFIRPIVRGKTNCPTEFGPKYDIAVDGDGFSWITGFSFDSFNESSHLIGALEGYKERIGNYPARVLADQIYRTRANRDFCKEHGIRLSGPKLGRKPKDEEAVKERAALERQDMIDRIEVERRFSRTKRCFGIGRIYERTPENVGHAVGMSVFLDNAVPAGF